IPCGICNTCRRVREGKHLDVKYIAKDSSRATISVDEVRRFKGDSIFSGAEDDFRFYIFENAEVLTVGAQNSILKILEEPPEGVYFILLSEGADKLLTTISSRVQRFDLQTFSQKELEDHVTRLSRRAAVLKTQDPDGFHGAIAGSGGTIGCAVDLIENDAVEAIREKNLQTREIISVFSARSSYSDIKARFSSLPTGRQELIEVFEDVLSAIGDLLTAKYSRTKETLVYKDNEEARLALNSIGIKRALMAYELINDALRQARSNVSAQNITTTLISKIVTMK
ncbi:MAG: hypothetical protein IKV20_04500, partial [Clostridia bacterium]|nr:hypothetical protein [Clostridia bacterium]